VREYGGRGRVVSETLVRGGEVFAGPQHTLSPPQQDQTQDHSAR